MHAKTTSIALLAVVIFALSNPLSAAQQVQQIASTGDDEATHEALRTLKREMEESFNKVGKSGKLEDLQGVLDHVHDNVVLAAMNGSLVVGKQGIIEYFKRTMTGPTRTVKSVHHVFDVAALTTLYGGNTGVAYGSSTGTYALMDGLSFEVHTNWTATMVKEEGQWLVASFQFGPNIFDNPLLNKAVRALYWSAGIAGGIGLLLGLLLGKVTARKPRAV
jgi:ketosteroid isomerase-like protein